MNKPNRIKPGCICGLMAVTLLAVGCGAKPPVPLETVPANAKAVGLVDLKQLAEFGLLEKAFEIAKGSREVIEVGAAMKLARADAKAVLDTAIFVRGDSQAETAVTVIGTFDEDKIRESIEKNLKAAEIMYKKYKLLRDAKGRLYGAINRHVLVCGHEKTVKKILDILKGDAKPMPAGSRALGRVKGFSDSAFWFTTLLKSGIDGEGNMPERLTKLMPGPDLSMLRTLTVAGKMTAGAVDLTMVVGCVEAEIADKLRDRIRNRVDKSSAKILRAKETDTESAKLIKDIVASTKIESKDQKLTAGLRINLALIKTLQKDRRKQSRQKELTLQCTVHLKKVATGCDYHVIDDGQFFPAALHDLATKGIVRLSYLGCPADWPDNMLGRITYESAFELTNKRLTAAGLLPGMIMVWDNEPRHGGKRCVAFKDGHVEVLAEAEFQKHLKTLKTHLASWKGK